jgi:hypothetical protein
LRLVNIAGIKPIDGPDVLASESGLILTCLGCFWLTTGTRLSICLSIQIDNFADNFSLPVSVLEKSAVYPGSIDRRRSDRSIGSVE